MHLFPFKFVLNRKTGRVARVSPDQYTHTSVFACTINNGGAPWSRGVRDPGMETVRSGRSFSIARRFERRRCKSHGADRLHSRFSNPARSEAPPVSVVQTKPQLTILIARGDAATRRIPEPLAHSRLVVLDSMLDGNIPSKLAVLLPCS